MGYIETHLTMMRIYLPEWFNNNMGYIETQLLYMTLKVKQV